MSTKLYRPVGNKTLWPIGSVYLSVSSKSPATLFGGTWEQISGYYLYAGTGGTKTDYTGIGTQGHLLTANQCGLRNHAHSFALNVQHSDGQYLPPPNECLSSGLQQGGRVRYFGGTDYQGGWDAADKHSHNIATYQIYAWKRVS
jgi:hypothetical protein